MYFYRLNSAHRNTSLHANRHIIFLVPKLSFTVVIDADSFHPLRPFVVLSSVMAIRTKPLGQRIMGSLDNGIWGVLTGSVGSEGGQSCRPLCVGQIPLLLPTPSWAPWEEGSRSLS